MFLMIFGILLMIAASIGLAVLGYTGIAWAGIALTVVMLVVFWKATDPERQ